MLHKMFHVQTLLLISLIKAATVAAHRFRQIREITYQVTGLLSNITYSFYLIAVISISQQMLRCKPKRDGGGEGEEGEREIEEGGGKREEEREGRKSHWLDLLKCLLTLRTFIHCSPQWSPSGHSHLGNRARTQSLTRVKLGVERGDQNLPTPRKR